MSVMGVMTNMLSVPVCNSFEPTVLNDRLCYRVDPNHFKFPKTYELDLKQGFIFFIDHNEDRQTKMKQDETTFNSLLGSSHRIHENEESLIYLDTIGEFF